MCDKLRLQLDTDVSSSLTNASSLPPTLCEGNSIASSRSFINSISDNGPQSLNIMQFNSSLTNSLETIQSDSSITSFNNMNGNDSYDSLPCSSLPLTLNSEFHQNMEESINNKKSKNFSISNKPPDVLPILTSLPYSHNMSAISSPVSDEAQERALSPNTFTQNLYNATKSIGKIFNV